MVEARQLAAHVLHEAGLVGLRRREREGDDEIGDVVRPVLGDGEQEEGEAGAGVLVEAAEQPEVEQRQPPVLRQEHVALVGIGVVHALDHHLEHVGAEELAREVRGALRREPVPRRDLAARDPLQDHRALAHVRPDHPRHHEPLERLDELPHELRVVRLLDEVELGPEMDLELVRELLELDLARGLGMADCETHGRAQQREIEIDLLDDAGPPHLEHDIVAGGQQPAMRLRDRSRGERLRVDAHERLLAEVGQHDSLDLREGDSRRDVVHEPAQLLDVDVGQEIGTRREELAELDEGRPELLEPAAERLRPLARRVAASGHADLAENPT